MSARKRARSWGQGQEQKGGPGGRGREGAQTRVLSLGLTENGAVRWHGWEAGGLRAGMGGGCMSGSPEAGAPGSG